MGIVVTVFMLLGLLVVSPLSILSLGGLRKNTKVTCFIGAGLLLTGLWNSLWHGLRFLDHFWGMAAFVSGIFMVCVAVTIFVDYCSVSSLSLKKLYIVIKPLSLLWFFGLLVCFLLYGVTLIQLNLGHSIIG